MLLINPLQGPITIYEDNQGAIALAANPLTHRRTRHIDVRYHLVREQVAAGLIRFEFIPTASQLADGMTKVLLKLKHMQWVAQIMHDMPSLD
jgi:hypothetical protein